MRKRRGRSRNTGGVSNVGPNANVITYSGPSKLPERVEPEIIRVEVHSGGAVTSSGGGVVDTNVTSSTVRTLGDDFSSWAAVYREYRVLSIRVEYHPDVTGASIAAILYKPVYTVVDRLDASASTSYANIESNTSLEIFTLQVPWMREAKMSDTLESNFVSVAQDGAIYSIKYFSTGLTATTTYGRYLYRYVLEFRTRV